MANKRHNKQVPGYKKGGKVKMMGGGMMMKRSMMKEGGASKRAKPVKDPYADYIRKFKEIRKPKGAKRLGKMGGGMMKRPMMKEGGKLKMVMKGGKKVPFFAADGKGAKDLGKATGMKKGGMAKLNPGLRKFMMNKMKKNKGKM
jgi:hypothetical protein